jgi:Zn finger protein HypA/HybF involved in hydrogenase expression
MVVAGIEVRLGAMVDLGADELRTALRNRLGPGIEVQITTVAAVLRCLDCGAEYPGDEHPCPVCGSGRAELIHGAELQIARAWGSG